MLKGETVLLINIPIAQGTKIRQVQSIQRLTEDFEGPKGLVEFPIVYLASGSASPNGPTSNKPNKDESRGCPSRPGP